MHPHNRYLGQHEILSQYTGGVDNCFPPPVRGHLQHSWDAVTPCPDDLETAHGMISFVWSDRARRRLSGRGHQIAIGAPWLYLLRRDPAAGDAVPVFRTADEIADERRAQRLAELAGIDTESEVVEALAARGTVWFPVHGLRGARLARDLAREIARTGPATVVLTDPDDHVESIRIAYESVGIPVRSAGPKTRGIGETGPGWLERLRAIVARHERVASNAVCTELLYGASAGLPVEIAGPPPTSRDDEPSAALMELRSCLGDDAALHEFALAELGHDVLMPKADLTALLDWSRP